MGMSKYEDLYARVMNHLNDQDWESAYSLVKNGDMQGDEMQPQFWQNSICTELVSLRMLKQPLNCSKEQFQGDVWKLRISLEAFIWLEKKFLKMTKKEFLI